jgi:hypothetical protein
MNADRTTTQTLQGGFRWLVPLYAMCFRSRNLLAGLALSGCGGDASSTTGPMPVTPQPTQVAAAPVASRSTPTPAPAPAPAPRQLVSVSSRVEGPGCVRLFSQLHGGDHQCGGTQVQEQGLRGSASAIPNPGARFIEWAASSSDCPGQTSPGCSFAFDRNKTLVARFGS